MEDRLGNAPARTATTQGGASEPAELGTARPMGEPLGAPLSFPQLSPQALHGLAGEVVRAIEPHSEADPAALLGTLLTGFGALVGPGPHGEVEAAAHPAKFFTVICGESSRARKGSAQAQVSRVLEAASPEWSSMVTSGFGSGEALVDAASDAPDGRLLIFEAEFARVLTAMKRPGSSLSSLLRQAWDGSRLEARTRGRRSVATGVNVSMCAHVTLEELRSLLRYGDVVNGFANRCLFVAARRSKLLPRGGELSESIVRELGTRLGEAAKNAREVDLVRRTPEAEEMWDELYAEIARDDPPGPLGAASSRAEAQLFRLSVAYALIGGSECIDTEHLTAAWSFLQYCRSSAALVFADEPQTAHARRLLEAIEKAGREGLDLEQQSAVFSRHLPRRDLEAAREMLEQRGLIETTAVPTGGRPRRVSRLVAAGTGSLTGELSSHVSPASQAPDPTADTSADQSTSSMSPGEGCPERPSRHALEEGIKVGDQARGVLEAADCADLLRTRRTSGAEWEWFHKLGRHEKSRITRNWRAECGSPPDVLAERLAPFINLHGAGIDTVMSEWLKLTRQADMAVSLRKGYWPKPRPYGWQEPTEILRVITDVDQEFQSVQEYPKIPYLTCEQWTHELGCAIAGIEWGATGAQERFEELLPPVVEAVVEERMQPRGWPASHQELYDAVMDDYDHRVEEEWASCHREE